MVIFALTLIRHGETGHNKDNVIQGQTDVPLSSTGLHQAQLLGVHLQHQKYTHVYASDLSRAKRTAEVILDKSQVCKERIIQDERLRERKFGAIEGKSFKYLKEAASKANQSVAMYTPCGAETVQQMRQRGISFFLDLCHSMRQTEPVRKNETADKPTYQQSSIGNGITETKDKVARSKRKREDSYGDGLNKVGCSADNNSLQPPQSSTACSVCLSAASPHAFNCSSASAEDNSNHHTISPTFNDDVIRSHLTPCECVREDSDCPNVSLSPLVSSNSNAPKHAANALANADVERERRLSVCSSSDENDGSPDLAGNILVVSHGGLLKELVRYFLEELGCSLPGGKKQAMRISPNAGLSKFTVSVGHEEGEHPKIICHQIHDRHHLHGILDKIELADNTAL